MRMNEQKLYPQEISITCRNFSTVFGNHRTTAKHGHLTQRWNILDFGVHSQILFDGGKGYNILWHLYKVLPDLKYITWGISTHSSELDDIWISGDHVQSNQKGLSEFGDSKLISLKLLLDELQSYWCTHNRKCIQNPPSATLRILEKHINWALIPW